MFTTMFFLPTCVFPVRTKMVQKTKICYLPIWPGVIRGPVSIRHMVSSVICPETTWVPMVMHAAFALPFVVPMVTAITLTLVARAAFSVEMTSHCWVCLHKALDLTKFMRQDSVFCYHNALEMTSHCWICLHAASVKTSGSNKVNGIEFSMCSVTIML